MASFILTILFVIFAGLGLVVSIAGLRKPEVFLAFEQKCHKKIFKKEFNPNKLTRGKIKRIAFMLLCVTIFLSVSYVSLAVYSKILDLKF